MTKINLSIIIPTWNTAEITLKCVTTIDKYLKSFSHEIIVIDNGSTDNTKELLRQNKKLILIENKENLGFAKANNQAVRISNGEYLLFLNSDMELIDNSIVKMYEYISKDNTIGAIGPQFLNIDMTPQASVFPKQNIINAFNEFFLNKNSYSKYLPKNNNPTSVWSISGGAFLIKNEFFKKIGGWNEKYFFYFEDLDLCRTIHNFKKKIIYFPECRVIHRHGASGQNLTTASNQWRRLIPSSIKYHGIINHHFINFIIWSGQKLQKFKKYLKF
jgi:GT2 family glycosyltransferase